MKLRLRIGFGMATIALGVLLAHALVPHAHLSDLLALPANQLVDLPVQPSQLPEHHLDNFRQNDAEVRELRAALGLHAALITVLAWASAPAGSREALPAAPRYVAAVYGELHWAPPTLRGPPVLG